MGGSTMDKQEKKTEAKRSSPQAKEMVMSSFRSFDIVPVKPSSTFTDDVPEIFVVFHLHQHDSEFRVSGRWLVEQGEGVPANFILGTDSMILMTEDESGYVSIS